MIENKSGRRRGLVLAEIRRVALKMKTFTIDDLMPALEWKQADSNCFNLMRRGEIKKLVRGRVMGGWIRRAVYRRTRSLRRPELTNKLLTKRKSRRRSYDYGAIEEGTQVPI